MLEKVCELCAIPADRHHSNVRDYGNTAARVRRRAEHALDDWTDQDDVAIAGVGAGSLVELPAALRKEA